MFCSKQALKMCLIQNKILSNSFVFFFYHITINHFLEMIGSLISNFTDFRGKSNSFLLNHAFYMNLCILFVMPFSCCWNTYSAGFCLFVYLFLVSFYFFVCLSQPLIIIGQLIPLVRSRKFVITSDSAFVKTKSLKKMWGIGVALHKNQIKWVPLNGLCT